MRYDVSVIGLYILDVLGRPVTRIPDRGNVDFIEEIRLTVAGTAGGTVVDTAKLGLKSLAVGAVGDDEKADWILLTLGGEGAYYAHRDGTRLKSPAYDVRVVDTTGCGDAFDAGFIASLHHKMDTETALRFAQASAGLVATGLGSDAGIVSFEDTRNTMMNWKIKP